MALAKVFIRCPYCKERIAADAVRCKHCHADLTAPKKKFQLSLKGMNNFRTGFLCGILFVLIVIVLVYYQFYAGV